MVINSKAITYTALANTVADVVAGLQALLAASTIPEFKEVTWTVNGTANIVGTAKTAGVPFVQTSSAAGGTATLVTATPTASAGPNDWSTAGNWSLAAVPVATNDVYIENSSQSILYGLDQHTIALTSLNVAKSFTGNLGLPAYNPAGYAEYRSVYLQIQATTVNVGYGPGNGSQLIKIDSGSATATTVNCNGTSTPSENGGQSRALLWKGTNAGNVLNLNAGSVGVAFLAGETAAVATANCGFLTNRAGDLTVDFGTITTVTTLNHFGGRVTTNSAWVTVNQNAPACTLTCRAVGGTFTTVTSDAGTVVWNSTSTITSLFVGNAGAFDHGQDERGATLTNVYVYDGGVFKGDFRFLTLTNGLNLRRRSLQSQNIDVGTNINIVVTVAS